MSRRGQKLLLLAEGGLLTFEEVSSGQGKILLESQHLGKVAVDMPAASVIYLPAREQTPAALQKRHGELGLPAASTDFLVAEDAKGAYVPVPGVLKAIAAGKVTFEFQKQDRTTDLSLVRIIQLARVAGVPSPPGGYLTAGDGSVLPFAALTFDGTTFSARRDGLTAEAISPAGLAEIRFHSDRLVYLSDLKPAGAVQTGLFDVLFPFRLDRSAAGGPLRLGKTTYAKGLGLHSRCELTYDLQGRFAVLAALAGIDQAGGKRGNAELRILGDGRELLKPTRLAGGDNPVPVRCVVSGVGKLTLIADFGPDGVDVGDYVDLVEARLIRP
jgi:hypothetical protein